MVCVSFALLKINLFLKMGHLKCLVFLNLLYFLIIFLDFFYSCILFILDLFLFYYFKFFQHSTFNQIRSHENQRKKKNAGMPGVKESVVFFFLKVET